MIAIIPIALYIIYEMNYDKEFDKYKQKLKKQRAAK